MTLAELRAALGDYAQTAEFTTFLAKQSDTIRNDIARLAGARFVSAIEAGEGRRLFGHTTPSELPDKFNMSVRMPIGVVGVITPWNWPYTMPAELIAPALRLLLRYRALRRAPS